MAQHNTIRKKVTLSENVKKGHIVSFSGHLATTGTVGKEPAGVAMYDGSAGDLAAIMCIGLMHVTQDGTLALGDGIKAVAGAPVKAVTADPVFATVSEVPSVNSAELLLK